MQSLEWLCLKLRAMSLAFVVEERKGCFVEPAEQNPVWKTGRAVRYQNKPEMPESSRAGPPVRALVRGR